MNSPVLNPRSLHSRIVSGSIVLISGSSLANAINLAYNIAVARFLGPTGFGHATAVYTLLTLISAVTLSFQFISTKAVAQQASTEGKDSAYRVFHRAAWACGISVALLLVLFQQTLTRYLNLPSPILVVLLAVGAAFYVPLGSRRGYVQGAYGFQSFAKNLLLEGSVRLGGSLLMVLLGLGVTGVIAANAAAIAAAYFALAPRLAPKIPSPLSLRYAVFEASQAIVFFTGQVLINNCDIVLVKHYFDPRAAGLYAAVAMVGRVIFAFSSAVVNSMFPVVAGSRDEERKNLSLISVSILLVLGIGSILALGLRLTPAWVWTRFFGPAFQLPGPHGMPYLLTLYAITTVIYSLSVVIITYEMSYKIANSSWIQLAVSVTLILGICRFHASLQQVILVQLVLMSGLFLAVCAGFLYAARRDRRRVRGSIRLVREISEDEVVAEFLRSDFEDATYSKYREALGPIVLKPDLDDPEESAKRRSLLFLRHRMLWKEIPIGTVWYEAEITLADLPQIQVFPRAQWRKIAHGDFALTRVVERLYSRRADQDPLANKIATLRTGLLQQDAVPGSVVLIGIDKSHPLTILDGNHRFVAAVMEKRLDKLRFFCGLSPRMTRCCWYRTNLATLIRYSGNLLWHHVRRPSDDLEYLFKRSENYPGAS